MNVGAIMTRDVVTVSPDDSLRQVRAIFESLKFHHVMVVEHGRLVGVVSDRDLLKNLSPFVGTGAERTQDLASLNRKVHQVMTRRLVTATESMPVPEAGRLMIDHRVSCLPVLNARGGLAGIVTLRDLLQWALVRESGSTACAVPPR